MLPAFYTFFCLILVYLIPTVADINGSRPCLLKLELISLRFTIPYPILLRLKPAPCESYQSQTVVPWLAFFTLIKNKLEHGEHIRNNLFNHYWSRRAVPEVPLSWWKFVSIFLSFPYGKLWVRPRLVELVSLELTTSWMPFKRSPYWAITPFIFISHLEKYTHSIPSDYCYTSLSIFSHTEDKSELRGATPNFLPWLSPIL